MLIFERIVSFFERFTKSQRILCKRALESFQLSWEITNEVERLHCPKKERLMDNARNSEPETLGTVVHSDLIVSRDRRIGAVPNTLAGRFGELILQAEERFGPRDPSYLVIGTEFHSGRHRLRILEERRQIVIQLSLYSASYPQLAYCQLAHECVHVLSPSDHGITVLEESLAVLFSERFFTLSHSSLGTLEEERSRVIVGILRSLLEKDGSCIRRLRMIQPSFSRMTIEDVRSTLPSISRTTAEAMLSRI